ncbi:MAG: XRE family transcriptional regulator, partial [Erysipelotrichia bacterium]|nr:XRE family transcriptional regulator [Erysipelotrichia bacterium]
MSNRLPEKLKLLRNHCNYAQGDVSKKLGVAVEEYMDWENGNKLCTVSKLKEIAAIYKIPVEQLIDNTKEVDLPRLDTQDDSVQIPFLANAGAAEKAAPVYQKPIYGTPQNTVGMGDTIQVGAVRENAANTNAFEKTTVNRIVDTDAYATSEYDEEDEEEA